MHATTARVMLVDDDADTLDVLSEWLTLSGYEVKTASDGLTAISLAKQEGFDLVVTDLHMPGLNGLQLLAMLKAMDPTLMVIFLTGQGTMEAAIAALREGRAFDFLQKPLNDLQHLNQVLERALARRAESQPAAAPRSPVPPSVEPLSPRETEIMRLVAEGLENREIAATLYLSEKTIQNHLTRIYEKLKVNNRAQAVNVCLSVGLL